MSQHGLLWSQQEEQLINILEDGNVVFHNGLYHPVAEISNANGRKVFFEKDNEEIKLLRQKNPYFYKDEQGNEYLVFANNVYEYKNSFDESTLSQKLFSKGEPVQQLNGNTLIQGDNLHGLALIQEQYAGLVDFICIDPPYNTGNEDMKYNDLFPILANGDRHSSWLSFMHNRLELAKKLMSDRGLIFINIDEYEYPYLKLLCDQVFGFNNFIESFIWEKNSTKNNSRTTSTNHENILCYAKDKKVIEASDYFRIEKEGVKSVKIIRDRILNDDSIQDKRTEIEKELAIFFKENKHLKGIKHYKRVDEDYRIYRISDVSAPAGEGLDYAIIHPDTGKPCKQPASGYRYSKDTIEKHIADNRFHFGKDERTVPQYKRYLEEVETEVVKSVIRNTDEGRKDLEKIFGKSPFNNPKPVSLIKYLISMMPLNNMTCLDFFAGSGTTGHAVMEYNKENGTKHKFILMTNNENNICDSITHPRLVKAKELLGDKNEINYLKIISEQVDKFNVNDNLT